jgi:hypothetical protein
MAKYVYGQMCDAVREKERKKIENDQLRESHSIIVLQTI